MAKKVNTRTLFGQKILRRLGSPVIKINVSDDQIDDAIDDALEWLIDHHRDFSKKQYYVYQIIQDDVDNGYLTLPENIIDVVGFCESNASNSSVGSDSGGFGTQAYHIMRDYNLAYQQESTSIAWNIVEWEVFNMFNETVLKQYNGEDYTQFIFDKDSHTLKPIKVMVLGDYVAIECYQYIIDSSIDATTTSNLFGVVQFQELAAAILKKTWGGILSKFAGIQMPGTITLNGEQIKQEAIEEIEKLKEKIDNENEMHGLHLIIG